MVHNVLGFLSMELGSKRKLTVVIEFCDGITHE